jgi:hypothetical protein
MLSLTIMDLRAYARAWHDAGTKSADEIERTPYTDLLNEIEYAVVRERMNG